MEPPSVEELEGATASPIPDARIAGCWIEERCLGWINLLCWSTLAFGSFPLGLQEVVRFRNTDCDCERSVRVAPLADAFRLSSSTLMRTSPEYWRFSSCLKR